MGVLGGEECWRGLKLGWVSKRGIEGVKGMEGRGGGFGGERWDFWRGGGEGMGFLEGWRWNFDEGVHWAEMIV